MDAQVHPVQIQPGNQSGPGWMPRPAASSACPPGLEYLASIDQLLIKQQIEMMEVLTGWESKNKYRIFNSMGQQCYFAFEESGCCMYVLYLFPKNIIGLNIYCFRRSFCGDMREFTMHIVDNMGQEVIRISRPFKCLCGFDCCLACRSEIIVEAPPGVPIGSVLADEYCCNPSFKIIDADGKSHFDVYGRCAVFPKCGDVTFLVSSLENQGVQIGKITKQWSGFMQEYFTDADNFGISCKLKLVEFLVVFF